MQCLIANECLVFILLGYVATKYLSGTTQLEYIKYIYKYYLRTNFTCFKLVWILNCLRLLYSEMQKLDKNHSEAQLTG